MLIYQLFLAILKGEVDKTDIDKLKTVLSYLSKLSKVLHNGFVKIN